MPLDFRRLAMLGLASACLICGGCTAWQISRGTLESPRSSASSCQSNQQAGRDDSRGKVHEKVVGTGSLARNAEMAEQSSASATSNQKVSTVYQVPRPEYQSPAWPESVYWEEVYRQINAADTREVSPAGVVIQPLQPLPVAATQRDTPPPSSLPVVKLASKTKTSGDAVIDNPEVIAVRSLNATTPSPATVHRDHQVVLANFEQLETLERIDHGVAPTASAANGLRPSATKDYSEASTTALPWLVISSLQVFRWCQAAIPATPASVACGANHHGANRDSSAPFTGARLNNKLDELSAIIDAELAAENLPNTRQQALLLARRVVDLLGETETSDVGELNLIESHFAAIETLLSRTSEDSIPQRNAQTLIALNKLREAEQKLICTANLRINNPNFCSEVLGFGQYREIPTNEFSPNQPVLIYCELENHVARRRNDSTALTFTTRLRTSLVVCNEDNRIVQQIDFPTVEDHARCYRRDFYLYVPFTVGQLNAGRYRLYLSVTDLEGNKTTTLDPPLAFAVR